MAKIDGKPVDPKRYATRVTNAKKIIAKMDPEAKKKIAQMYSKPTQTPKPIAKKTTPKMPGMGPISNLGNAQKDAMDKLTKEREAWAKKHNGAWPTDAQLMKSRKSK